MRLIIMKMILKLNKLETNICNYLITSTILNEDQLIIQKF